MSRKYGGTSKKMKIYKLLFIIFVLTLFIGGCATPDTSETGEDSDDTGEQPTDEYDAGFEDALKELNELQKIS